MAITEYVTEPDRNHCADKVMIGVTIIDSFLFIKDSRNHGGTQST